VAIISRGPTGGNCTFASKSANAGLAGALGLVVYNNLNETTYGGTLGTGEPAQGPTIPTLATSNANGLALAERFRSGEKLTVGFVAATAFSKVYRYVRSS
jgi:hypothetical protein